MPKKRHLNKYSKPQSTAPALLSSTTARRSDSRHDDQSRGRGVNELLADLRRAGLSGSAPQHAPSAVGPTVPPAIRQILQLPETPAPRPRRPVRVDASGARLPPGPAPPRSWLSGPARQRTAVGPDGSRDYEQRPLPGARLPGSGSLVDMVLRRFVLDWEWQRSYCRYHLYELPTHLRVALVSYLATYTREGVSLRDLRAVLLPPPDVPEYRDDPSLAPAVVNEAFRHLDLSGSLGRSLKLRELSDLLFPTQPAGRAPTTDPQESWEDAAAAADQQPPTPNMPRPLLPNLAHLSLALDPASSSSSSSRRPPSSWSSSPPPVSWRHLLALAAHLPGLTHLSLAFWPAPTLTPNAARLAAAVVVVPHTGGGGGGGGRAVPYGGTGPYSHSLDDDWAEAVLVLRRLSARLYGLEHLDLTGCGEWFPALWASVGAGAGAGEGQGGAQAEADRVDWAGPWAKITALVMYPGYRLREAAGVAETAAYWEVVDRARRVERHVRSCRAGRGRWVTVETCRRPGEEMGQLGRSLTHT